MSSLTLTIGGTNFLPVYKTGSCVISSQLQNQGNTLSMRLAVRTGGTLPQSGQEIVFKDGSRFLFGGFVTRLNPTEYGVGQLITYDLEASDYTYLLTNKYAQASYTNQTLAYIVADLLSTNLASGYGVTHTNTATGPTIASVTFNHISLRQCFEKLAKLTNYIWWMDYEKDLHFVDPAMTTAAPETVTDSSSNIETMVINTDVSQVRNQIVIQGGTQASANYADIFIGDGQARGWVLTYAIKTMITIELDTGAGYVTKIIGVEGTDDETVCYFMYSTSRGSFRMASGSSTPTSAHKIRVTYKYALPVLTIVSDSTSIALMSALEGGDGVHGFVINDSTITSQEQARKRGQQELLMFALPILQGEFTTRTGLLASGSYFVPGQALSVNLPSWGISTTTVYLIQRVTMSMVETGSSIEYHYRVTFGGRMLGVTDFLLALATPEQALDMSQELQTVYSIPHVLTITESITRGTARSVTETVTVGENIQKDPLGAAVEPTWVLGFYVPSSPTDTKRMGRLNYSLKVY